MDDIKNLRVSFSAEGSKFVFLTNDEDLSNLLNKLRNDTVKFYSQSSPLTTYLTFEEIRDWNIEVIEPTTVVNAIQVTSWRV